jgi:hypothetical protein
MYSDDDEQDSGADDEYLTTSEEVLKEVEQEVEFERGFYEAVCDTDNFEVILIPDERGYILKKEDKLLLETSARQQGIKLLYRISHGKFATVFDPQTGKIGVMPETNNRGFAC